MPPDVDPPKPDTVSIPASWLRWGAPLIAGLVLGGGGATGLTTAFHDQPSAAPMTVAAAEAMIAELELAHDDLATKDDVADLLFIVCELANRTDPPVTDRRCLTR